MTPKTGFEALQRRRSVFAFYGQLLSYLTGELYSGRSAPFATHQWRDADFHVSFFHLVPAYLKLFVGHKVHFIKLKNLRFEYLNIYLINDLISLAICIVVPDPVRCWRSWKPGSNFTLGNHGAPRFSGAVKELKFRCRSCFFVGTVSWREAFLLACWSWNNCLAW